LARLASIRESFELLGFFLMRRVREMRVAMRVRRGAALVALATGILLVVGASGWAVLAQAPAREASKSIALDVDPASSKVHWTLGSTLHAVHGTFAVKGGKITVEPASGKAGGEIVIDAPSGESGNDGRDKKMHKEIIESGKYPAISFRPDRVDGSLASSSAVKAQIHGIFSLHGTEHELTVPFEAQLAGDGWKGTAKFTVPYIDWGLKSPSNFFLKANPTVDVELELAGKRE
jgi:polyisoprenoid-binding protein YceI